MASTAKTETCMRAFGFYFNQHIFPILLQATPVTTNELLRTVVTKRLHAGCPYCHQNRALKNTGTDIAGLTVMDVILMDILLQTLCMVVLLCMLIIQCMTRPPRNFARGMQRQASPNNCCF